jgi:hypothetical protein
MSKLYNIIKMIIPGANQKTYGTGAIKSVKPNVPKTEEARKEAAHKIKMATAITKTRQDLQKIRGEKITKSGFLKGKDIKND